MCGGKDYEGTQVTAEEAARELGFASVAEMDAWFAEQDKKAADAASEAKARGQAGD